MHGPITAATTVRLTGKSKTMKTLNRKHFIHLHATNPDHAGIIVCTFDADFRASAHRVHAAINSPSNLSTSSSQE